MYELFSRQRADNSNFQTSEEFKQSFAFRRITRLLWQDKLERNGAKELRTHKTVFKRDKIWYSFLAFYLVFDEILKPRLIQSCKVGSKIRRMTLLRMTRYGTSLVVQWLGLNLPFQRVWVRSLVRELRSHMLHGQYCKT